MNLILSYLLVFVLAFGGGYFAQSYIDKAIARVKSAVHDWLKAKVG